MIQRCQEPCFALEPPRELRIEVPPLSQQLERHVAPQPYVTGAINFAHSADAYELDDLV
jgi:hypothetical protein